MKKAHKAGMYTAVIATIIALILIVWAMIPCDVDREQNDGVPFEEQMLEHRIEHIGDNSGVARLLGFLPAFDEQFDQTFFALQTEEEPYGLILYFEPNEDWDGVTSMMKLPEAQLFADYLFESIDNLGYIELKYRVTSSEGELVEEEYYELARFERE
jgi:hypothetical protein